MSRLTYFVLIYLVLCACNRSKPLDSGNSFPPNQSNDSLSGRMQYAEGFSLEQLEGCTYIVVFDPWKKGDTLATYLLQHLVDSVVPCAKNTDFVIQTPVMRVASLSSTYLGMFNLLGEGKRITACSDPQLIYDSVMYSRYLHGDLLSVGQAMQVSVESIIGHQPDLLMKYIYGSKEESDLQLERSGIPIAYNMEFMETHPLGRAEWIKFVAAFIDKSSLADSLFREIAGSYQNLKEKAAQAPNKPTILDGSSYKGTWYAAGGKSYPALFYADAGADYFWKTDSSRGSIPLSFEVIIDKQANADFWIGPSTGKKQDLLNIEPRYSLLKSFKNKNVFHFDKRINPNGGLDYYEGGVVRPDILLKDLIWVFHPQLLEANFEPVYLTRIH